LLDRSRPAACSSPILRFFFDSWAVVNYSTIIGKSHQYADQYFQFARYSKQEVIEWIELIDITTDELRHLPVEFVYPRARIERKPLVAETSSGTASHSSRTAALLAAICELVERDSLMTFWHRQPPTNVLSIDSDISSAAAGDLDSIRAMGYVVVTCLLQYDLAIPCILVFALHGNRFAYGAGCHPYLKIALEHAVCELGGLLRWQVLESKGVRCFLSLAEVRKPRDHYSLYDGGPFHEVLRQTLKNTVVGPSRREPENSQPLSDDESLRQVVDALTVRGYRVYACDLTPHRLGLYGLSVMRAVVPGLIPLYFGYDRLRFGCQRVWSRKGPGRLCNLLPHFMT
jgi:ribosomal protein S12 methylthiotransferase accessory factor